MKFVYVNFVKKILIIKLSLIMVTAAPAPVIVQT